MALKRKDGEPLAAAKKGKRVGFSTIDPGIEANECFKVFIVNSVEEVDASDVEFIELFDVNHFFDDDGKIYGYKDLEINIWVSSVSFHAYADITFQASCDSGKGITDLQAALQRIFGKTLVGKDEFLQTFSSEGHFIRSVISDGHTVLPDPCSAPNGSSEACTGSKSSTVEVIRMDFSSNSVRLLYSRLVPLLLLIVEGSSPIDVTDPQWEIYLVIEKIFDNSGESQIRLLGFSTVYRYFHYPDGIRMRISQILVLPSYQGQGHGRRLLEIINSVAISENAHDITVEEPSDYLQQLRACIDIPRLLNAEPIKAAVTAVISNLKEVNMSKKKRKFQLDPPADVIEYGREKLKINKKQFLRCWEILLFLNLDMESEKSMDDFKACIGDRVKVEIVGKGSESNGKKLVEVPNEFGQDVTFVVYQCQNGDQTDCIPATTDGDKATREQQLSELVDERLEEIAVVAQKLLQHAGKDSTTD